jgi:D-alanyl-D-alanine carboxypeptidase
VTTRRNNRRDQPTRTAARRTFTAALAAGLAALTLGGTPSPAHAAIPSVAQTWSTLMYRSLTATATRTQLRAALAVQQTTLATRVGELTTAKAADAAAQIRLTSATTAETDAGDRYADAVRSLADAKKALAVATKKRPRDNAAVTRAQKAVTAATTTANSRKTQAGVAAAVRDKARTEAQSATTGLTAAIAAWRTATTAIRQTEKKIDGVGTATDLAGQAAAVSKDVVSRVRPAFTTADTVGIYGVTVHRSVSYAFKRMLDDAKADGIVLSGGGFRTKERQIELRKINGCPDIWTAPASSCRVPTAIPGRSLHEIGLAVDITSGGRTVAAKSPAFKWLVAHAGSYGFVNLPSEPWHWSITGS